MAELTVGSGFARGLMALAVSKGADARVLAEQAGIDPADLEAHDRRIPFAAYVALMRAAKALTGDAALALHYGEAGGIARVSIVGLLGQASETMAEAFAQLNRFVPLVVETENEGGGERFRLRRDRRGLWVIDTRAGAGAFPELTESAFAQLVCAPRKYGAGPPLKAVHVTHADPGYRAEYERIFQVPVVFGSDRNGFLFDEAWLKRRVAVLPPYALEVLRDRAELLLKALDGAKSLRGRVEDLLTPVLHTGETGMDAIAGKLALSRRTLLRRLKAEGATFDQVLDDLRHRLALDYLASGKVSVAETAYLTGFSDPAAFSRAFKRWTGGRPGASRGT